MIQRDQMDNNESKSKIWLEIIGILILRGLLDVSTGLVVGISRCQVHSVLLQPPEANIYASS